MKKLISLITCAAILWTGFEIGNTIAAVPENTECKELKQRLRQLTDVLQRKEVLEEALRECGDDPVITYMYAYNLEQRMQSLEAIEYYQKTMSKNPSFANAYFGMAESQYSIGDLDQAINYYQQGLKLVPGNAWADKRVRELSALRLQRVASKSRQAATRPPVAVPDEYYEKIAGRYGISINELKSTLDQVLRKTAKPVKEARAKTEQEKQEEQERYFKSIAKRYGIPLEKLQQARKQAEQLNNIADRYDLELSDLILAYQQLEAGTRHIVTQENGKVIKQQVWNKNEYFKNIADRYGIQLDDLLQAQNQAAELRNIADRYGLELSSLVAANQRDISSGGMEKPATRSVKGRSSNRQNEYLASVAARYDIQTDELVQERNQTAILKDIAGRYNIDLDLTEANRQQERNGKTRAKKREIRNSNKEIENKEYYGSIAKRYNVDVSPIEKKREQIASLKKVASRYSIPIEDIIQENPSSGLAASRPEKAEHLDKESQERLNSYLKNIADRYGLELDKLNEINKQMTSIKAIADQYGIAFDELIAANRKNTRTDLATGAGGTTMPDNASERNAYLSNIATRYALKLDQVSAINDRISSLSNIANRYGLQLEELVTANRNSGLFDDESIRIRKEHIVSKNEYLGTIAARYSVSIDKLLRANKHIKNKNLIFPGELIRIPR